MPLPAVGVVAVGEVAYGGGVGLTYPLQGAE